MALSVTRKRTDRTAITQGSVVGRGDNSGAASESVTGKLSAFALVGLDGVLFPDGDARQQPSYTSTASQQQIQGFSPVPPEQPCGTAG